ncbi:hypothetical protein KJ987_07670, partial [bacterium]|nr:hypothetical protein [bacterium]
ANTRYDLYKYNPSEKEYQHYGDYVVLEKGEYTFSVEPGVYKITASYREKEPSLKKETDDINMADKITQFIPIDFGSEGLSLPQVKVKGLIEIGDNDGIFELEEKVSVDFEVSSGNMEKILVYLNDEKLKEYNQSGQYYIESPVNKVGDNNLKISLKNNKIDIPIEIPLKFIVNPQDGKSGKLETVKKNEMEEEDKEKEKIILPEEVTNDSLEKEKGKTANLSMVIITSLTSVFSLATHDLIVTIDGPVYQSQTFKDVGTAAPVTVYFYNIPEGHYEVTAKYGSKTISKEINVSGDTYEFQMIFN